MICGPCKLGGKALQLETPGIAAAFHAECKGGTHCDCQHDVRGSALNLPLLTWLQKSATIVVTVPLKAGDPNLRIALGEEH